MTQNALNMIQLSIETCFITQRMFYNRYFDPDIKRPDIRPKREHFYPPPPKKNHESSLSPTPPSPLEGEKRGVMQCIKDLLTFAQGGVGGITPFALSSG